MENIAQLSDLFFHELKKYNSTNFRSISKADLSQCNYKVYKSLSSVVTRFFLFAEMHPEISSVDLKLLYFKLKIDMIARYFSQYPVSSYSDLVPFQVELNDYIQRNSKVGEDNELEDTSSSIQDIELASVK